jgi:hypothetical protein
MAKQHKKNKKKQISKKEGEQQQPRRIRVAHQALLICLAALIFCHVGSIAVKEQILESVMAHASVQGDIVNDAGSSGSETKIKMKDEKPSQSFSSDWEMIKHFSLNYDSDGLHQRLKQSFDSSERAYDPSQRKTRLHPDLASRGGALDRTTRHKLIHDMEQFDYYCNNKDMNLKGQSLQLFQKTLPAVYGSTLQRLDAASKRGEFDEETEYYKFGPEDKDILHFYNRAMFMPSFGRHDHQHQIDGGMMASTEAPLLTPRNWSHVEKQWFGEDPHYANPGIVVVDDVLSPETLRRVREYLLVSTMWYEAKTPRYGRYVGAYIGDGLHDTLLTEVAYELHRAMPRVMEGHALKQLWSYKYESSAHEEDEGRTGVHVHADDAMVNLNIWLTPDEANLDPTSGGLVVYTVKPPQHMVEFTDFNSNWEYVEEHLLRPSNYENVTIPYKQNRAVIFDSFLFHRTDRHRFKSGYENRRINLTFLYGDKQSTAKRSAFESEL